MNQIVGLAESGVTKGNAAGGGATTLYSYTLRANQLHCDGDSVEIEASGSFVGAAGTQIIVNLGATPFGTGVITPAASGWLLKCRFMRSGPSAQKINVNVITPTGSIYQSGTAAENNAAPITITIVGYGTSANDVQLDTAVVDFRGVAP